MWTEATTLSPEVQTLLACARAVLDGENLEAFRVTLAGCPSADRLCEAAVAHGMLGHLHHLVGGQEPTAVDPSLVRRLSELYRASGERSLRQTGFLLRVLEQLRAGGVEVMPFKGPAWAQRLYGDVALRSWVDLDLLVRYEQMAAACEVLLAHGFIEGTRFNERKLRVERGGWGHVVLAAVEQAVSLELHWEVTVGFSTGSLRAGAVFSGADSLRLLSREVTTPSRVDMLLITCLNGTRDRWDSVEGLLGLALQVRDAADSFWPRTVAVARAVGCARRVTVGVAHACRVLTLQTPREIADALAQDAVGRALLRSLRPETLERPAGWGPRGRLASMLWAFASEDSVSAGLRHAAVRFFRPGPDDWEAVALPRRAEWLYYPLRPFLVAGKWAKRL